ncbi:MAG TPA: DUF2461 domain-containing protein [Bryobacteraceae bacterium]|nr:DUF2461 domain-containing protein [Bryobacteraceae bacterium]
MPPEFAGFPAEGLDFFRKLKRNNRREWFQPRKQVFDDQVRKPMVELVEAVNRELVRFAPEYVTEPERAIYRIYRDTRFSADKTPYKTHIAASFPRRGLKKHACAGLYFSVSNKELEVAGGVYMPTVDELRAIRLHLMENHEEFRRIVRSPKLRSLMGEMQGECLTRVPKGFPAGHPAEDLVRGKQWLFFLSLDPELARTAAIVDELVARFKALKPFCEFLNRPLSPAKRDPILETGGPIS